MNTILLSVLVLGLMGAVLGALLAVASKVFHVEVDPKQAAVRQCLAAREASGIETAALSGGSFQNMRLMARLPQRLEAEGFRVLRHRRVSCNDEGLSLGQLMIAREALRS